MNEIYSPKDWSHEEQLKHIMSVEPGVKQPFDWWWAAFVVVVTFALVGVVATALGIAHLIGAI